MTTEEMRTLAKSYADTTPDGESQRWWVYAMLSRTIWLAAAEICERLDALKPLPIDDRGPGGA